MRTEICVEEAPQMDQFCKDLGLLRAAMLKPIGRIMCRIWFASSEEYALAAISLIRDLNENWFVTSPVLRDRN